MPTNRLQLARAKREAERNGYKVIPPKGEENKTEERRPSFASRSNATARPSAAPLSRVELAKRTVERNGYRVVDDNPPVRLSNQDRIDIAKATAERHGYTVTPPKAGEGSSAPDVKNNTNTAPAEDKKPETPEDRYFARANRFVAPEEY